MGGIARLAVVHAAVLCALAAFAVPTASAAGDLNAVCAFTGGTPAGGLVPPVPYGPLPGSGRFTFAGTATCVGQDGLSSGVIAGLGLSIVGSYESTACGTGFIHAGIAGAPGYLAGDGATLTQGPAIVGTAKMDLAVAGGHAVINPVVSRFTGGPAAAATIGGGGPITLADDSGVVAGGAQLQLTTTNGLQNPTPVTAIDPVFLGGGGTNDLDSDCATELDVVGSFTLNSTP